MNDAQLIEQLAITDIYGDDVALPETMRPDMVLLDIARRMDMDTKERQVEVVAPRRHWNGALIAAAAFALVVIIGLATVLLSSGDGGGEPVAPPTTAAVESIDIGAAEPIQAVNDQGSRVTIDFAGDARALAEGGTHVFGIQLDLEGSNELNPGITVNYLVTDGVVATTGTSPGGAEVKSTWRWDTDDKVIVTMVGVGVGIPDTRPQVVVTVQTTPSSDVFEFVMDSPAP
ncbi:MAG: hypothetical protein M3092_10295 [Actinomycetia bacterium]|nr:hypothetical protein [Actinomycetes bacterium]